MPCILMVIYWAQEKIASILSPRHHFTIRGGHGDERRAAILITNAIIKQRDAPMIDLKLSLSFITALSR